MTYLKSQQGSVGVVVAVSLLTVGLIAALGFAGWAYKERSTYKNDADQLVAAAVQTNTKKIQAEDASKYAEAAKQPYRTWVGPSTYGSLQVTFPKTWSVYSQGSDRSNTPLDVYFNPETVPSVQGDESVFALRAQVVTTSYDTVLKTFTSFQKSGKATVTAFSTPKNSSIVGVKVTGQISNKKQGTMVVLPLRDKTLKIWTEASAFQPDFDTVIIPNVQFTP